MSMFIVIGDLKWEVLVCKKQWGMGGTKINYIVYGLVMIINKISMILIK